MNKFFFFLISFDFNRTSGASLLLNHIRWLSPPPLAPTRHFRMAFCVLQFRTLPQRQRRKAGIYSIHLPVAIERKSTLDQRRMRNRNHSINFVYYQQTMERGKLRVRVFPVSFHFVSFSFLFLFIYFFFFVFGIFFFGGGFEMIFNGIPTA